MMKTSVQDGRCVACRRTVRFVRYHAGDSLFPFAQCPECRKFNGFVSPNARQTMSEDQIDARCKATADWARTHGFAHMFQQQSPEKLLDAAHCQALKDPSTDCQTRRANTRSLPDGVRTKSAKEPQSAKEPLKVDLQRPLTLDDCNALWFYEAYGVPRGREIATAILEADKEKFPLHGWIGGQVSAVRDHEKIEGRLREVADDYAYATIETRNGNVYVLPSSVTKQRKAKADDLVTIETIGEYRIIRQGRNYMILDRDGQPAGRYHSLSQAREHARALVDGGLQVQLDALLGGTR